MNSNLLCQECPLHCAIIDKRDSINQYSKSIIIAPKYYTEAFSTGGLIHEESLSKLNVCFSWGEKKAHELEWSDTDYTLKLYSHVCCKGLQSPAS